MLSTENDKKKDTPAGNSVTATRWLSIFQKRSHSYWILHYSNTIPLKPA